MTLLATPEVRSTSHANRGGLRLALLDGFRLTGGTGAVPASGGTERLLAFMAMHHRPVERLLVAGSLWAGATEGHAYAALRSALTRMNRTCREALLVTPCRRNCCRSGTTTGS